MFLAVHTLRKDHRMNQHAHLSGLHNMDKNTSTVIKLGEFVGPLYYCGHYFNQNHLVIHRCTYRDVDRDCENSGFTVHSKKNTAGAMRVPKAFCHIIAAKADIKMIYYAALLPFHYLSVKPMQNKLSKLGNQNAPYVIKLLFT